MKQKSWKQACLVAAFYLSPNVLTYTPGAGSAVSGNLDTIDGPYGIPSDKFQSATKNADTSAAFNITGYNISTAAGTTPRSVPGWTLTARVKNDVSLSDATANTSSSAEEVTEEDKKSQKFEATTLYVESPVGMSVMDPSWRICAVVYPGLASAVSDSTTVDGTCNGVLSTECMQAVTATAGGSGNTGIGNNGDCSGFVLPSRCTDEFPSGSENISAISINQTILDNKRFYAFGSDPTSSDNSTAEDEAKQNVWPVIMIFGHLSSGGQLSSANTAVQCVRAVNGTTEDDIGSSASRSVESKSLLTMLGVTLVASWVYVL